MQTKMWAERLKVRTTLFLHVKPNKLKTQILEEHDGVLIVAVKALPIDNKANQEIERYFTRLLKRKATITQGFSSRKKKLLLL